MSLDSRLPASGDFALSGFTAHNQRSMLEGPNRNVGRDDNCIGELTRHTIRA
jgi:hypothetical protein